MTEYRGGRQATAERTRQRFNEKYRNNQKFREQVLNANRARRYGITDDEYAERIKRPCAVCGAFDGRRQRGYGMHVDHDHRTGTLRGTLCGGCNKGIGAFGDSSDRLLRAVWYLLRHQTGVSSDEAYESAQRLERAPARRVRIQEAS
jgi:hypothetical protein